MSVMVRLSTPQLGNFPQLRVVNSPMREQSAAIELPIEPRRADIQGGSENPFRQVIGDTESQFPADFFHDAVLGKDKSSDLFDSLGGRDLDQAPEQLGAKPVALPQIIHQERKFGSRAVRNSGQPAYRQDLARHAFRSLGDERGFAVVVYEQTCASRSCSILWLSFIRWK